MISARGSAVARRFLLWAASAGLAPPEVAIGTSARTDDREIMSDTDRALLAVRLAPALVDRVAGAWSRSTDNRAGGW